MFRIPGGGVEDMHLLCKTRIRQMGSLQVACCEGKGDQSQTRARTAVPTLECHLGVWVGAQPVGRPDGRPGRATVITTLEN